MTIETTVDWDVIYEYRQALKWKRTQEQREQEWDETLRAWQTRMGMLATSERDAVEAWTVLLEPHFEIKHEVSGRHWTGKNVRIDMLLRPRGEWRGGGRYPFGFEVKKPLTNEAKLVGQAVDYANSMFDLFGWGNRQGRDHVFIAVYAPSYHNSEHHNMLEQMHGRLGVIHFDINQYHGLELRVSGNRAWTQEKGPCSMNWSAQRKFGSR